MLGEAGIFRRRTRKVLRGVIGVACGLVLVGAMTGTARAQGDPTTAQIATRAVAAGSERALVQVVQQGINSLPPISSQAYYFEYDDTLGTLAPSERAGATVFRESRTFPKGKMAFRVAGSFFSISDAVTAVYESPDPDLPTLYTAFGSELSAKVKVLSFSATFGVTDFLQLDVGLPVTFVNASQKTLYPKDFRFNPDCGWPAPKEPCGTIWDSLRLADARQLANTGRANNEDPPTERGEGMLIDPDSNDVVPGVFNDGSNVGLGRVSLGAKAALPRWEDLGVAFIPTVLFPSPASDDYAGPDSFALGIEVAADWSPVDWANLLVNLGYEWDLDSTALTRFAWSAGAVFPTEYATLDIGAGGSVYQDGITWGPTSIPTARSPYFVLNDSEIELDSSFVDVLVGIKVPLGTAFAIAGTAVIPVDDAAFRPGAFGTLFVEAYF